MNRILAALLFVVVAHAVVGAFAVVLHVAGLPLLPGVVVIAYATLAHPPIEGALTATFVGVIIDAVGGTPLGVNSLAAMITWVAVRPTLTWIPGDRGWPAAVFAGVFSLAHAAVAMLLLVTFGGRAAFDLGSVLLVGVGNGLTSFVVLPAFRGLLVMLRLQERSATLSERLSTRSG